MVCRRSRACGVDAARSPRARPLHVVYSTTARCPASATARESRRCSRAYTASARVCSITFPTAISPESSSMSTSLCFLAPMIACWGSSMTAFGSTSARRSAIFCRLAALLDATVRGALGCRGRLAARGLLPCSPTATGVAIRSTLGAGSVIEGNVRDRIVWDDCRIARQRHAGSMHRGARRRARRGEYGDAVIVPRRSAHSGRVRTWSGRWCIDSAAVPPGGNIVPNPMAPPGPTPRGGASSRSFSSRD